MEVLSSNHASEDAGKERYPPDPISRAIVALATRGPFLQACCGPGGIESEAHHTDPGAY